MFDFYNPDLRILNFTHIDFDGAASAVVIKNYYKNVQTEVINYGKEQEAYDKMTKNMGAFDAVVFTDFCPVNIKQLQKLVSLFLCLTIMKLLSNLQIRRTAFILRRKFAVLCLLSSITA